MNAQDALLHAARDIVLTRPARQAQQTRPARQVQQSTAAHAHSSPAGARVSTPVSTSLQHGPAPDCTSPWATVRALHELSLCDWAGHMSLVLFCGGCNLRCPTCHNAALAWQPELFFPVQRERLADLLHQHRQWYEGIVITGGEATIHPQLPALVDDLRELSATATGQSLPIKLDTNGMQPDCVARLLAEQRIAAVSIDIKGCYEDYPALTGNCATPQGAQQALEACYDVAQAFPHQVSFRLTRVPAITPQHIEQVQAYLPAGQTLTIQNYVPPRTFQE